MLRRVAIVAVVAGCSVVSAQDCRSDGCGATGMCCMCSCDAGDYNVGSFSCNCDSTKKHKPLPNDQQPTCCGGEFGFDAWCLKKDSPAVNNLQCSNQSTAGIPLPASDFYEFSTQKYRCVYPPHSCNSAFCDNPTAPDLSGKVCHKPYVPSPSPAGPAPSKPAPEAPAPKSPGPASCSADANRPLKCPCDHSYECFSEWCVGTPATCEKQPILRPQVKPLVLN